MKAISMLEFRRHTERVIEGAKVGERMLLTYRGKALYRLEPCVEPELGPDDPFYQLADHADEKAQPLTNGDIDKAVYEV